MQAANVNPDTRVRDLTDEEVKRISAVIDETQTVEGDLQKRDRTEYQETTGDWMLSVVSVIEKDFLFVVRRQRQTQEQEKVLREQLQTRRNKQHNESYKKVG